MNRKAGCLVLFCFFCLLFFAFFFVFLLFEYTEKMVLYWANTLPSHGGKIESGAWGK